MTTFYQLSSNFGVHQQDGESTPYDARSLVNPPESSGHSNHSSSSYNSSTTNSPISLPIHPKLSRSRATSDALEKILTRQSQQFSAVCEEWRSKFASSPFTPTNEKKEPNHVRSRATSDALERLLARQSLQLTALGDIWRTKFSIPPNLSEDESEDERDETDHQLDIRVSQWLCSFPTSTDEMWLPEEDFEDIFENGDDLEDEDELEDGLQETYQALVIRVCKWLESFPDSFDEISKEI